MRKIELLILAVLLPMMATAQYNDAIIDGICYNFSEDEAEVTLSKDRYSGDVVIPETVSYNGKTYPVTSIDAAAFMHCRSLNSITIPNNMKRIESFQGCLALTAVHIKSLEAWCKILFGGSSANPLSFAGHLYQNGQEITELTIPESITTIGAFSFKGCKGLTSVTIPKSVMSVGLSAFEGCSSLTDVYCYPDSLPDTPTVSFPLSTISRTATLHVPANSVEWYSAQSPWKYFGSVVALPNYTEPIAFTAGQMATIVLPTEPDAGKGKYYRLAGCKEGEIVFEQELQPRAHVPYIIVPHEDFSIDPAELELAGLTGDTVSVDGVRFIGTYMREVLPSLGGDGGSSFYYDIIDQTPDCSPLPGEGQGVRLLVGALRAYLLVDWKTTGWNDPYTQGGTKDPWQKMPIVLRDDATPIAGCPQMVNGKSSNGKCYDLQGRRISEKPSHGIYIEGGKVKARP